LILGLQKDIGMQQPIVIFLTGTLFVVFSYGLFWFLDIYINYTFRGTYLRNNKNKHIETSFFMQ